MTLGCFLLLMFYVAKLEKVRYNYFIIYSECSDMDKNSKYTFFPHQFSSIRIEEMLDKFNTYDEFEKVFSHEMLSSANDIANCVFRMLEKYNKKASSVSEEAGLASGYVGLIQNGKKSNPSRDTLLKICIVCHATVDETQELLKISGCQPLYVRRSRDVIIWFGLSKGLSLAQIDDELYRHNIKTLCK